MFSVILVGVKRELLNILVAIAVMALAIVLDLAVGDPSPNYPDKWVFKLHPTVVMGKYTKKIEPYFKNPNPKIEKFLGVLLALTVIGTFAVPAYFGLMGNLHLHQHLCLRFRRHNPCENDHLHQA